MNDFSAAGRGISRLAPGELETLQAGSPLAKAARLIIGAGTGLGVGLLTWQDDGYTVHPSEAGHGDFATHGILPNMQKLGYDAVRDFSPIALGALSASRSRSGAR